MRLQRVDGRRTRRPIVRAGATAIGALALGAMALGGLAIGFLAIRRFAVGRSHFGLVKMNDLTVHRLQVGDLVITGSIQTPATWGKPSDATGHRLETGGPARPEFGRSGP